MRRVARSLYPNGTRRKLRAEPRTGSPHGFSERAAPLMVCAARVLFYVRANDDGPDPRKYDTHFTFLLDVHAQNGRGVRLKKKKKNT